MKPISTLAAALGLNAVFVLLLGCGGDRYQLIAQNVAAAGAGGADGRPETQTIRGNVYRLDRKTGEVILIGEYHLRREDGTLGIGSFRVIEPDETAELMKHANSGN